MEEGSSVQFGDGLLHKENGFTIKIVPDASDTIHTIHLSAQMAKIGIRNIGATLDGEPIFLMR